MNPLILVIDDDVDVLQAMKLMLSEDFQVITANDLDSAKDLLAKSNPEIIILDLGMQKTNGAETLNELRRGMSKDVPIIISTGGEVEVEKLTNIKGVLSKGDIDFKHLATMVNTSLIGEKVKTKFYNPLYKLLESSKKVVQDMKSLVNDSKLTGSVR